MINLTAKDTNKIKMLIACNGQSLKGFTQKVGLSYSYMSRVVSGKENTSANTGQRIADGLGVKLEEIFYINNPVEEKEDSKKEVIK